MLKIFTFTFIIILIFHLSESYIFANKEYEQTESKSEQIGAYKKSTNRLIKDLEKILRDETKDVSEAIDILEKVCRTRNQQFIPLVKEIAESDLEEKKYLNFYSFVCLQKLGQPNNYFLIKAWNYRLSPRLAFYSILVLSYFPDKASVESLKQLYEQLDINKLDEAARGSILAGQYDKVLLQSAINKVLRVYKCLEDLEKKDFNSKVDYLLNKIGPGFGCKGFRNVNISLNTDSERIWVENMLYLLSLENASLVVEVIKQKDILAADEEWSKQCSKDFSVKNYRKYLSQFVSDETKELLLELENKSSKPENNK